MRGKRLDAQERDDSRWHLYARREHVQIAPLVHQERAPRLLHRLRLPNSILQLIAKFPQSIAGREFLLGRTLRIDKSRQMVAECWQPERLEVGIAYAVAPGSLEYQAPWPFKDKTSGNVEFCTMVPAPICRNSSFDFPNTGAA